MNSTGRRDGSEQACGGDVVQVGDHRAELGGLGVPLSRLTAFSAELKLLR